MSCCASVELLVRRRFVRVQRLLEIFVAGMFVVVRRFDFLDFGDETVFVVSSVLDNASRTVGFHQAVRAFDVTVSIVRFVVAFDVVRVRVFHVVSKMIRCGGVSVVVIIVVVYWRVGENHVSEQKNKHNKLKRETYFNSLFLVFLLALFQSRIDPCSNIFIDSVMHEVHHSWLVMVI